MTNRRLPYPETYPGCVVKARTDDGLELIIDMSYDRPKVEKVIDRKAGTTYVWDIRDRREVYDTGVKPDFEFEPDFESVDMNSEFPP